MTENMKKLVELVSASEDLKAKVNELSKQAGEDMEKAKALLTAFAQEQGIALTDEDFSPDDAGLSDDELQAVAGGGSKCACVVMGTADGAFCMFGGGGSGCVCVIFGTSQ